MNNPEDREFHRAYYEGFRVLSEKIKQRFPQGKLVIGLGPWVPDEDRAEIDSLAAKINFRVINLS